jgi:hypothetical protein
MFQDAQFGRILVKCCPSSFKKNNSDNTEIGQNLNSGLHILILEAKAKAVSHGLTRLGFGFPASGQLFPSILRYMDGAGNAQNLPL